MRHRWKVLIGIVIALAVLLGVNAIVVGQQTKSAEVTIEGGRILSLPGGDVQVVEEGPTAVPAREAEAPIVLLHCYSCSLHWWDRIAPILAERHRVIRVDLLGHGGSEKPSGDYSIEQQAQVVAGAMNELGAQGAVVVGNSLGAVVAAELALESSQLVDRVVDIGMAPNTRDFGGGLPFVAKVGYVPVLGEAAYRITPDFAVKDAYSESFAPGFDVESGFPNPDQVVDDFRAMSYSSYDAVPAATDDYLDEMPLDARLRQAAVPAMVVFGIEDQLFDAERALAGFDDVPGVRTGTIPDAGHAPHVEQPEQTAALILEFAADPGDEALGEHPPRRVGLDRRGRGRPD
jgi:pimeloyl-ACP methyl ester carboxylesterase